MICEMVEAIMRASEETKDTEAMIRPSEEVTDTEGYRGGHDVGP